MIARKGATVHVLGNDIRGSDPVSSGSFGVLSEDDAAGTVNNNEVLGFFCGISVVEGVSAAGNTYPTPGNTNNEC